MDKDGIKEIKLNDEKVETESLEEKNVSQKPPPSIFKKAFFWLCGIESTFNQENKEQVQEVIDTSIDQDPFWATVCDVNAIIALGLAGFCFAFFNKFD